MFGKKKASKKSDAKCNVEAAKESATKTKGYSGKKTTGSAKACKQFSLAKNKRPNKIKIGWSFIFFVTLCEIYESVIKCDKNKGCGGG